MRNPRDTLRQQLTKAADTERATLLNDLSYHLRTVNSDSAFALASTALELSKQQNNREEEARAYSNLSMAALRTGRTDKAESFQKLSLLTSRQLGDSLGTATALNNLSSVYLAIGNH